MTLFLAGLRERRRMRGLVTKTVAVLMALVMLSSVVLAAGGWQGFPTVSVRVNGKVLAVDAPAIVIKGRTFLPLRSVADAIGAAVAFDPSTQTVDLSVSTVSESDVALLQARSEAAESQVKNLQADLAARDKRISSLETDLSAARSELQKSKSRVKEWESPLETAKSELEKAKSELDKTKSELEKANSRISELEAKLQQSTQPSSQNQQSSPLNAVIQRVRTQVFRLEILDQTGKVVASGSAVAVGSSELMTNYHVIDDAVKVVAYDDSGRSYAVSGLLASREELDLAVLRVDSKLEPTVVRTSAPQVGDEVIAIGSPRGLTNTASTGIVSAQRSWKGVTVLQVTAPISPGSSGGGLFDRSGQLIGITFAYLEDSQNLNFAIPMSVAAPLIQEAQQASPKALPGVGRNADRGFWQAPPGSRKFPLRSGSSVPTSLPRKNSGRGGVSYRILLHVSQLLRQCQDRLRERPVAGALQGCLDHQRLWLVGG